MPAAFVPSISSSYCQTPSLPVKMFRNVAVCLALASVASAYKMDRDDGYGAPEVAYEEPAQEYGAAAPAYGATAPATPDLTPIIIGILVLTGLSLLFPTYVTLTSVRRRRSAEGSQDSSENSLVERVQDIYMAVVESEECMERVACEVGGIAADAGINMGMTKVAESFVPKKYQKMMKNFNSAKDCHKIKCGAF